MLLGADGPWDGMLYKAAHEFTDLNWLQFKQLDTRELSEILVFVDEENKAKWREEWREERDRRARGEKPHYPDAGEFDQPTD